MHTWIEGGHGVTMETGHVGAYVIRVIRAHINLHLCHRPHGRHPTQLVWKTRRLRVRTKHCSQITHALSLEAVIPAYWALCQVGRFLFFFSFYFIYFFYRSSECVYLRSLKDDQAKQDVIRAKQKQRWGISMQLKSTSCKCKGTWYRHSIFKLRRQRGRKKETERGRRGGQGGTTKIIKL